MSGSDKCKAVVFIDSLGMNGDTESDLEHMPWLKEHISVGKMDASPVYVTPVVLGSIYTGLSPTEHGLPSLSRYDQPSRQRPAAPTAPEIAAVSEKYENVANLGLPFIVPPDVEPNGNYWHSSAAINNSSFLPGEAEPQLNIPGPAGQLDMPEEDLDLCYNLRLDHCVGTFAIYRNLIASWDLDAVFIGYRVPDSYAHWHFEKPPGGQTYRQGILEQIDEELEYLSKQCDLFVFGDHGAMEMADGGVFRINRWLMEHGYLDIEIDHDWMDKAVDYGAIERDDSVPGHVLNIDSPGVTLNEEDSVVICDDPFSTGLTLLDGATEENLTQLIEELGEEPAISSVEWTRDIYGPGELEEECPDLYACRNEGYFVSGNIHPEPGGAEVTRTGVHHPVGIYGGEGIDPARDPVGPTQIFDYIMEFLDLDPTETEVGTDRDTGIVDDVARGRLEDLGYI